MPNGSNNSNFPKNEPPKATPSIEVPALSLDELKEKTDNFGTKALVGEGSYGRVYLAVLNNGNQVAVKKFDSSSDSEASTEFLVQVSIVSRLKHENVVEMLGYCVEGNLRLLAYEFATMGSLHDILHGMTCGIAIYFTFHMLSINLERFYCMRNYYAFLEL
ncbi:hypothetical protein BHM03_00001451 [Ensete ventricosum]|nr:hypothetical protein BHM03_00001451 [Ensete ventricosum]